LPYILSNRNIIYTQPHVFLLSVTVLNYALFLCCFIFATYGICLLFKRHQKDQCFSTTSDESFVFTYQRISTSITTNPFSAELLPEQSHHMPQILMSADSAQQILVPLILLSTDSCDPIYFYDPCDPNSSVIWYLWP